LVVLSYVDSSRYFAPTVQTAQTAMIYDSVPGSYAQAPSPMRPLAQPVYVLPQSGPGQVGNAGYFLACCAIFGVSARVATAVLNGNITGITGRTQPRMTATLNRTTSPTCGQIPFRAARSGIANKTILPEIEGLGDFDLPDGDDEYANFQMALLGHEPQRMARGTVVKGRVTGITPNNEALVDIGTKSEARIAYSDATLLGTVKKSLGEILVVGEEYEFQVLGGRGGDDADFANVLLTRKPLLIEEAWDRVEQFAKDGPTFMATVVRANAGGVLVTHPEFGGLTGFVPGSMIVNRPKDNEMLVDKELEVKFLQADKADQRIILSNRAVVQEKAMANIKEHDLVTGTVAAIMNFGVFVDVQGVRGMIHVSQVSGLFVDPTLMEKLFPVGSSVKAVVTKTEFNKGKLALSTRILETTAGEMRTDPQKVYTGAAERHVALQEQWKLEEEAREKERKELESQIMDLTLSVFDGADAPAGDAAADKQPGGVGDVAA
jgi:small subunit ribosomal protein S1